MGVKIEIADGIVAEITTDIGFYSDDPYSDHEVPETYVNIDFSNGDKFHYDVRPCIDPTMFCNYILRPDNSSASSCSMEIADFSDKKPIQFCLDFIDHFCWNKSKSSMLGDFIQKEIEDDTVIKHVDVNIELTDAIIESVEFAYEDKISKNDLEDNVSSIEILFDDGDSVWIEFDPENKSHRRKMFGCLVDIIRETRWYSDKVTKASFIRGIVNYYKNQTLKRRVGYEHCEHYVYNAKYFCSSNHETATFAAGIYKSIGGERETIMVAWHDNGSLELKMKHGELPRRYEYLDF